MNVWHDLDPKYITPGKFTAVIEIPEGSKKKYELDKRTGLLRLDRIPPTTASSPGPMPTTGIPWTFWCCVPRSWTRWWRWSVSPSAASG